MVLPGPDIDAELIQISATLWQELGLAEFVSLELNNIGSAGDRNAYGQALTAFLEAHASELDDDARRRMHSNPMRVLDSKNTAVQSVLADAPVLADFVSQESCEHFEALLQFLQSLGIEYSINPKLVRGLDYYNNCVFEWTTDQLGAQSAVCGGGATTDWSLSWEAGLPWRPGSPWALSVWFSCWQRLTVSRNLSATGRCLCVDGP